jgi:hypothetical protein
VGQQPPGGNFIKIKKGERKQTNKTYSLLTGEKKDGRPNQQLGTTKTTNKLTERREERKLTKARAKGKLN